MRASDSHDPRPRPSRRPIGPFAPALAILAATFIGLPQQAITAQAATKHGKWRPKAKPVAAKACLPPTDDAPPLTPGAKVAVFAFTGDDPEPVRRQVLHLLHGKGLRPVVSLRPVDSPEQFREMATTLGLVAYVDGEVESDGTQASATVFVRSGASGLRVAAATFAGDRRQLPAAVGKGLWDEVRVAFGRACADSAKPRKPTREPLRINAGAPIGGDDQAQD
jgi:hypothetical protein